MEASDAGVSKGRDWPGQRRTTSDEGAGLDSPERSAERVLRGGRRPVLQGGRRVRGGRAGCTCQAGAALGDRGEARWQWRRETERACGA
jgi:hypothetical protein